MVQSSRERACALYKPACGVGDCGCWPHVVVNESHKVRPRARPLPDRMPPLRCPATKEAPPCRQPCRSVWYAWCGCWLRSEAHTLLTVVRCRSAHHTSAHASVHLWHPAHRAHDLKLAFRFSRGAYRAHPVAPRLMDAVERHLWQPSHGATLLLMPARRADVRVAGEADAAEHKWAPERVG